jgi:hypothetical protein
VFLFLMYRLRAIESTMLVAAALLLTDLARAL